MVSLVRAACLTNFHQVARDSGLDPDRMLFNAGFNPSVLDEPDWMVPVSKVELLLQNAAKQSGNDCFGLRMASTRLLSNLGPVGMVVRDQETLRDSLTLLTHYLVNLNSAMTLALEEHGQTALIQGLLLAGGTGEPTRQRVELAIGVIVRAIRQLIGKDWQPAQVCFEHAPPKDLAFHTRMFGPRVYFNQDMNGILCTRADLDTRNEFADPAMVRYAQKLLTFEASSDGACILEEVRRAILVLLPSGRCNIEQVSEHMGLVPRTTQRRLREKGQSFSVALNDIRRQLAARYVLESRRSLTEITDLLGFTATSCFSRWYQIQFGCSAKESRARSACLVA